MVLNLIAPPHCGGCGQAGQVLCLPCAAAIRALAKPPQILLGPLTVTAAYHYDGPLRGLTHRAKYRDARTLLRTLAELALDRIPPQTDALIPIPLGKRRHRERGYNQAELLAREWATAWRQPIAGGLVRTRSAGQRRQPRARRRWPQRRRRRR